MRKFAVIILSLVTVVTTSILAQTLDSGNVIDAYYSSGFPKYSRFVGGTGDFSSLLEFRASSIGDIDPSQPNGGNYHFDMILTKMRIWYDPSTACSNLVYMGEVLAKNNGGPTSLPGNRLHDRSGTATYFYGVNPQKYYVVSKHQAKNGGLPKPPNPDKDQFYTSKSGNNSDKPSFRGAIGDCIAVEPPLPYLPDPDD